MTVSKEQWEEIEKRLSGPIGRVELKCDGYEIAAVVRPISPLKFGIEVYIDGFIKGEWVFNEANSEIPRKFHCEKKSYVYKGKMRAWLLKESKSRIWPKEKRAEYADDANKTMSFWYPYWTSPRAFCRHIRKTCTSIEVVKIGY